MSNEYSGERAPASSGQKLLIYEERSGTVFPKSLSDFKRGSKRQEIARLKRRSERDVVDVSL